MTKVKTAAFRFQEMKDLTALTDLLAKLVLNYREAGDEKIAEYFHNILSEVCPIVRRACGCELEYEGVNE